MEIVELKEEYIPQASQLVLENYIEEQQAVPILPEIETLPDLTPFEQNHLGVAAIENGKVVGFLGCYEPWEHAFDSNAIGTFSPIHAHGAAKENREKIYQYLYQAAAKKWIQRKISYHAIACFAHDQEAIEALFGYGFGSRCVDAIRPMEPLIFPLDHQADHNICYQELDQEEVYKVRSLRKSLSEHLGNSPCFMYSSPQEFAAWIERAEHRDTRVFVAKEGELVIAFVEVAEDGENFATETRDMKNICGAFCLPEYRGRGIYQGLVNHVITILKSEGYARLGVDYESFNPTAARFWPKLFIPYTKSVVRRIDECALLS